jgi:hypothetical protein
MTEEELRQAEQIARQYGPANCWTGTSGMMSEWILRLVKEVETLRSEATRKGDCGKV